MLCLHAISIKIFVWVHFTRCLLISWTYFLLSRPYIIKKRQRIQCNTTHTHTHAQKGNKWMQFCQMDGCGALNVCAANVVHAFLCQCMHVCAVHTKWIKSFKINMIREYVQSLFNLAAFQYAVVVTTTTTTAATSAMEVVAAACCMYASSLHEVTVCQTVLRCYYINQLSYRTRWAAYIFKSKCMLYVSGKSKRTIVSFNVECCCCWCCRFSLYFLNVVALSEFVVFNAL